METAAMLLAVKRNNLKHQLRKFGETVSTKERVIRKTDNHLTGLNRNSTLQMQSLSSYGGYY